MRGVRAFGALVGLTALVAAGAAALPADAAGPPPVALQHVSERVVCGPPAAGTARCHAHVTTRGRNDPTPLAGDAPYGLDPATIRAVYGFSSDPTAGTGKTIAIVDAFHSPTAKTDLDFFNSTYGLPTFPSCNATVTTTCFEQVDQTGGTSYPAVDGGWGLEIALDVQWAHAIAPGAKILLVEATDNSFTNLLAAEDFAAAHADYVSNSWGAAEFFGESSYDSHFAHGSVSFFVSAGDNGTPAEYPSSSPNVISVGGTTLNNIGATNFSETGWADGGGGCSRWESAPAAQRNFSQYGQTGCKGTRATPDVSLDADPASGVSVYDTTAYNGTTGWYRVGGTSASAPMWAGRSAVEGVQVNSAYVYGRAASTFRDITVGNNGAACKVGFDLCSGRGSWVDSGASGGTTTTSSSTTTSSTTSTTAPAGGTVTLTRKTKNKTMTSVTATWSGFSAPVTVARQSSSTTTSTSGLAGSGSVTDNWRTGSGTVTYTVCGSDGVCLSQSITI